MPTTTLQRVIDGGARGCESSLLALALGRGQAFGELVARALRVAEEHLGVRIVEERVRDLGVAWGLRQHVIWRPGMRCRCRCRGLGTDAGSTSRRGDKEGAAQRVRKCGWGTIARTDPRWVDRQVGR